jgi:hypothetical protein
MKTILAALLAIFVFCIALPFSLCFAAGPYTPTQVYTPIDTITPGVVDPNASPASICDVGTKAVRNTTSLMKAKAYTLYGVDKHGSGRCMAPNADKRGCEVDHRIPLAVGGADHQRNLWPQPYPQASWKDRLEDDWYHEICRAHAVGDDTAAVASMHAAQRAFSGDWRDAYRTRFGEMPQ